MLDLTNSGSFSFDSLALMLQISLGFIRCGHFSISTHTQYSLAIAIDINAKINIFISDLY